jgi:hypothetical protein
LASGAGPGEAFVLRRGSAKRVDALVAKANQPGRVQSFKAQWRAACLSRYRSRASSARGQKGVNRSNLYSGAPAAVSQVGGVNVIVAIRSFTAIRLPVVGTHWSCHSSHSVPATKNKTEKGGSNAKDST